MKERTLGSKSEIPLMPQKVRKAVFPAAGLGTRFLPATKASPKEMLPLVDKPLIQYVVEEAVASGIESVIIVTGRGKAAIEDHFDVSFELEKLLEERGKEEELKAMRAISEMARVSYVRQQRGAWSGPCGAASARSGWRRTVRRDAERRHHRLRNAGAQDNCSMFMRSMTLPSSLFFK